MSWLLFEGALPVKRFLKGKLTSHWLVNAWKPFNRDKICRQMSLREQTNRSITDARRDHKERVLVPGVIPEVEKGQGKA
jgi:hypothetical protein